MKHCSAYCRAKTFAFGELRDYLLRQYRSAMYKGVLHIERDEGEAFIFPFGVLVIWGLNHDETRKLLEDIKPFDREPLEKPIMDEFTYDLSAGETRIHEDCIRLAADTVVERLAVSYGIAQSVKLSE
ncbi:MAG: RMD1 family protein, partial [Deltaproteobacteria bacterium]|nr:RMD1 family protein [Deltaproteobacteria bacterium]